MSAEERDEVSIGKLVAVLGIFLVLGGGLLVFVWRVLNQILTGQDPHPSLWIGLGLLIVFLVLLRVLRGWVGRLGGSER